MIDVSLRVSVGALLLAIGTLASYVAVFLGSEGVVTVGVLAGVVGLLVMLLALSDGGSGE